MDTFFSASQQSSQSKIDTDCIQAIPGRAFDHLAPFQDFVRPQNLSLHEAIC